MTDEGERATEETEEVQEFDRHHPDALPELNLAVVFLSLLSPSPPQPEELRNCVEQNNMVEEAKAKPIFQRRHKQETRHRQETYDGPRVRVRRSQTVIRDIRHGRRM